MNTDVVNLQNATVLGKDSSKPSQELGRNEFLQLLMTQLSAQDPMNPMDSTEFTAQLSQFASLEQLTNLGQKMDNLVTITGASNAANAVSLLGKEVRVNSNQIRKPGTVYYELENVATDVKLEVRGKDGRVVHLVQGLKGETGLQEVNLEGFPEGQYTVHVVAKDVNNKEVRSAISVREKVRAVNFSGSVPLLLAESGAEHPASQVLEIREVPPAAPGGES